MYSQTRLWQDRRRPKEEDRLAEAGRYAISPGLPSPPLSKSLILRGQDPYGWVLQASRPAPLL